MQPAESPSASTSQSLAPLSSSSSLSFPTLPPSRTMSNTSSSSSNGAPNRSTTSTPVSSQPRPPSSTALARGASSAFDFLFGPSGGSVTPTVQTPPQSHHNGVETGSDALKLDKGKAVARDQEEEEASASASDAIERQIQVDKILKRAEAAKLARAFRNRLALASFKTSRGWQDVTLDVIEPHLRDEALKRQQTSPPADIQNSNESSASLPPPPPPPSSSRSGPISQPTQSIAPTARPIAPKPPATPAADQPYQYQINYNARPPLDMDAVISGSGGGGNSAHKRNRSIDPSYGGQGSPYGSGASPYSTANVYRIEKTQESPTKRRNLDGTGTTPRQRQKSVGGSRRATPLRQSANGTPAKPPASSDPAFSSFVDAAAALTGMARQPSDPSISGSSEEELQHSRPYDHPGSGQSRPTSTLPGGSIIQSIPHPPHHHHAFPQPHVQPHPFASQSASLNGHPSQNYLFDSLPLPSSSDHSTSQLPPRPSTPEKVKANGGAVGSGENSEVAAADLMLFLAHSPSPVQTRKAQPTLGDGSGIKGRRLFGAGEEEEGGNEPTGSSNGNELAQSVFGGSGGFSPSQAPSLSRTGSASSPFITSSSGPSISTSRVLDGPFDPTSSASSAPISIDTDPSKPSSSSFASSSLAASAPLGLDSSNVSEPHLAFPAPGTPRQRQPSFNGSGWESFINASPSPTRATVPRGDTPPGLGGNGSGGEAGEKVTV
ncbi:hypothetical protein JCM5350_003324 [Sporobolomyces pararoseus]